MAIMNTYSIGTPPKSAGIYMLTNKRTGQIYIGSSTNLCRRYNEWKSALVCRLASKNDLFFEAIEGSVADDWTFSVVVEMPNATEAELLQTELRAIKHVGLTRPNSVLNVALPGETRIPVDTKGCRPVAKSIVLDEHDNPVSYPTAATHLGCNRRSLAKRLAKYRARGQSTVTLEHLRTMSEKWAA